MFISDDQFLTFLEISQEFVCKNLQVLYISIRIILSSKIYMLQFIFVLFKQTCNIPNSFVVHNIPNNSLWNTGRKICNFFFAEISF